MVRSAARSGQSAAVAALDANSALRILLGGPDKIIAGKPSQRPPLPWIQIGDVSEGDLPRGIKSFEQGGTIVKWNCHIWSGKVGENDEVLAIWEQIMLTLHETNLLVSGQTYLLGTTRLVTIFLDPSNTQVHGAFDYEAMYHNV